MYSIEGNTEASYLVDSQQDPIYRKVTYLVTNNSEREPTLSLRYQIWHSISWIFIVTFVFCVMVYRFKAHYLLQLVVSVNIHDLNLE